MHGSQFARLARIGQALLHAVHQVVVVERLFKEIEGAPFQAVDGHRHVAVAGEENHRQARRQVALDQLVEQGDAVHVGHAHVEQHAVAGGVEVAVEAIEELLRAGVDARVDAARGGQPGQRVAYDLFVVDDM